jgi:hypothetical protein
VNFTAASNFLTPVNSPSLVVNSGILTPGTSYVFTLKARQEGVTLEGSATTGTIVVVGPPTPGQIFTNPSSGEALSTMFTAGSNGWTVEAGSTGSGGAVSTTSGLRYTTGYVVVGARGGDVEVTMASQSAASTFTGLLPANVTTGGVIADARVFAYAEVAGGGGARARVEGTVRVIPIIGKGVSEAAADALKAAMMMGDLALRAAAAVTAAASLNTRLTGGNGASDTLDASEIAARKAIRAGAMTAVADAAAAVLADSNIDLGPEVLSVHINAVAAVAAVPAELTASTAVRGVEIIAGLLRAQSTQPANTATVRAATSMFNGAMQVVVLNTSETSQPPPRTTTPAMAINTTNATNAASRRRSLLSRRLLQNTSFMTNFTTERPPTLGAPPKIDPLAAKALDGSLAVALAAVRGQAPGETGMSITEEHISISASRHLPGDLGGTGGPFKAPHEAAGSYYLPPNLAAAVVTDTHADLFLFRVNGAVLPSATRIMSDGSSIDVAGTDGLRPSLADTDEITVHVPLVGPGLIHLEKVLYEYKCARHTGGMWDHEDLLVRTVSVTETTPGVGHVICAGKGTAILGYVVGVVVVPINSTLANMQTSKHEPTQDAYWFILGGTVAAGLSFGAVALFYGMRRHATKIAIEDRYRPEERHR